MKPWIVINLLVAPTSAAICLHEGGFVGVAFGGFMVGLTLVWAVYAVKHEGSPATDDSPTACHAKG